jgi:hypothetical protein
MRIYADPDSDPEEIPVKKNLGFDMKNIVYIDSTS